ncbi:MAG: hypothetical protein JWP46_1340 [Modestobacter sp.]|nr:hypothetical protein [Modestobacter sp.]
MSTHAATGVASTRAVVRHVLSHLVVPVLLATGMALAYLGAFHQPQPHALRLDVVGTGPQVATLAQGLQDTFGDAAAVRTVATVDQAREELRRLEIAGAYLPAPTSPTLMLATAGSDTTAVTVQRMLGPVALASGQPLRVEDVVPTDATDPTGQGAFFYLVALSVGGYSAAIAIGAASAGRLRMRLRVALGIGAAAVIAAVTTLIAGPLYGALPSAGMAIGALAWLYVSAVVLIGVGLHTVLGRWTTLALVSMFVMLNFTSAGGVFTPDLQPGFFASLHSFWIGSGLVEASRRLLYFPELGIGRNVLVLVAWALAGLGLTAVAALVEARRHDRTAPAPGRHATPDAPTDVPARPQVGASDGVPAGSSAEEEIEEAVVA